MAKFSDIAGTTSPTFGIGLNKAMLDASGLSALRTHTLPNRSGLLALLNGSGGFTLINGYLSASVASNALTVAVKTLAGADPSAGDPVCVVFRDATEATGTLTVVTLTAATSVTLSSGSAPGMGANEYFKLWIVGFNDAGTFRLGIVNLTIGFGVPLRDHMRYSSTAEGGAGGADNANVIYTGTAVTDKPIRILGWLEYTGGLGTAGTYASAPTKVQTFGVGLELPMTGLGFFYLVDEKAQNTAGGTFTSGADRVRDLTVEAFDTLSCCTLSSNQFTLTPGTYWIEATAPAFFCGANFSMLWDVTGNALATDYSSRIVVGTNAYSPTALSDATASVSSLRALVRVAADKTFEIRHRCSITRATNGFGPKHNLGTEVYTEVFGVKVM